MDVFRVWKQNWSTCVRHHTSLRSMLVSVVFFLVSLSVSAFAVQFAARDAGNSTTDILLDHLPVVNTDVIFTEGAFLFVLFVAFLLVLKPKAIAFTMKSLGLLIYTRSFFVVMTHIAPYPDHIVTDLDRFRYISSGSDLFFSGHTALPFMMALVFWQRPHLRVAFILCSIIAAGAVILGHLHYTIDVFAAYFITYTVYAISRAIFKSDYKVFTHDFRMPIE